MDNFIQSLGSVTSIIGAQWGDEGKGKAVDILAEKYDVIARACGGANAGHTIVVNGKKHVFHLLPSGCLHEGKIIVLGAGMVIHLPTLFEEIDTLMEAGIDICENLHISPSAHLLFDYHKQIDAYFEQKRSESKGETIGTTKRGIGPCYMDKAARTGLRMGDLHLSLEDLKNELINHKKSIQETYGLDVDIEIEMESVTRAKEKFSKRLILSIPEVLNTFMDEGMSILIEGAQATLLDIDHGTYPYVTSSSTTIAGALQGLGIAPNALTSCIGIAKAYCTRVGEGDFLTEETGDTEQRLRDNGGEYGATTGRPRRCGWLHIPDLMYGALLNGFTCWNITKLDVLDEEEVIKVGIGVQGDGTPYYEHLPGWKQSTVGIQAFEKLPLAAQQYIRFIESQTKVPVALIGTGPDREHMIVRNVLPGMTAPSAKEVEAAIAA